MTTPLADLYALGQSPWNDNVARDEIKAGKFQDLINNFSIVGVTSNPTIFAKAMTAGNAYDDQFRELAGRGLETEDIYEAMAIQDINDVLDIFRPVYDRTGGLDGCVSLEVSPRLAYDTDKTLAAAKRFFSHINKPNLLVKIPATREGIPAIEAAIAEGININVTLIFGLDYYEEVINAYISGLEKLAQSGKKPLHQVLSVASFFVSRVDTLVDKLLDEKVAAGHAHAADLKGQAAIANAKMAYQLYKQYFVEGGEKSERFLKLKAHGARVQRPLWASTSTKNPAYRDVLYVEELIGADTVDTMPPATIVAFQDHGKAAATIEKDVDGARKLLDDLKTVDIHMQEVTDKLLSDGAASFTKDYEGLLHSIDEKRKKLAAEEGNREAATTSKV